MDWPSPWGSVQLGTLGAAVGVFGHPWRHEAPEGGILGHPESL